MSILMSKVLTLAIMRRLVWICMVDPSDHFTCAVLADGDVVQSITSADKVPESGVPRGQMASIIGTAFAILLDPKRPSQKGPA